MSNKFMEINRAQSIMLPGNMDGWLDDSDLARFVVDVVEQLDTSEFDNAYKGGGSAPYPPKMMLALLFYCYAKGIFSSRKMEQASYELIPVLFITGGLHPDHDSINTFRKRFLYKLEDVFVMILQIAHGMGIFRLGEIAIDGTKIKANASKHKAMSWEYACKIEQQLRAEIDELLKRAELERDGKLKDIDIPAELQRRVQRIEKIVEIKAEIEARALARYEQEKAEYEAKLADRKATEEARGRRLGGKQPKEPEPGPRPKDQVSFTDRDSRIMPQSGGGFLQGYNAQATVDMETMLIAGQHVSQHPNDKQEVIPAVEELEKFPKELGKANKAALDNGYFSSGNVEHLVNRDVEPFIAGGRQSHNQTLEDRLAEPPTAPDNTTPVDVMKHNMKTPEGKKFYAKRKSTVEPVFGIIKEVMGFRQFMLRGLQSVKGEWTLVCIAYNLKRLCVLNT